MLYSELITNNDHSQAVALLMKSENVQQKDEDKINIDFGLIMDGLVFPTNPCQCFEPKEEDFQEIECGEDPVILIEEDDPMQGSSTDNTSAVDPSAVTTETETETPQPVPLPATTKRQRTDALTEATVTISDDEDHEEQVQLRLGFTTALELQNDGIPSNNKTKKTKGRPLGLSRPFQPPIAPVPSEEAKTTSSTSSESADFAKQFKNIEPHLIDAIKNEIMDNGKSVAWDDISGLVRAKAIIKETIVMPQLRPDLFTGLRRPPKGILLFGPPGTGKTLIGKCIASQSNSKFFSISAATLNSKWIGEGEKMVRALFSVAAALQPSVVFIDEIDSLLSQRSDTEHESSRRLKTEFLVRLDGATTADDDRVLVIGATNRPQELDDAARRRLEKRLYIPLPEENAREDILRRSLAAEKNCLTDDEFKSIAQATVGFSGADMKSLIREAATEPVRSISLEDFKNVSLNSVRPINHSDFQAALERTKATVDQKELDAYVKWNETFGSG